MQGGFAEGGSRRHWQKLEHPQPLGERHQLNDLLGSAAPGTFCYLYGQFTFPQAGQAFLFFGADDYISVWTPQRMAIPSTMAISFHPRQHVLSLPVTKGDLPVLVRVENEMGICHFFCSLELVEPGSPLLADLRAVVGRFPPAGDLEEIRACTDEWRHRELSPPAAQPYAMLLERQGDLAPLPAALASLQKEVVREQDAARKEAARFRLMEVYEFLGFTSLAGEALRRKADLHRQRLVGLYQRGLRRFLQGAWDQATPYFRAVYAICPDFPGVAGKLALIYAGKYFRTEEYGCYEAALRYFREAETAGRTSPEVLMMIGFLHFFGGQNAVAKQILIRSVSLSPDPFWEFLLLPNILMSEGKQADGEALQKRHIRREDEKARELMLWLEP